MGTSIYQLRHRDILLLCVMTLLCIGAIMVQSASMRVTGELGWRWSELGIKQVQFVVIGLLAFLVCGQIDYQILRGKGAPLWRHPIVWLVGIAILTSALVLIPHVGFEKNGARRWLKLPFFQLQPSELAKWAGVIFLARWLTSGQAQLDKFFRGYVVTLVPIGILCLLTVIQDFGTAAFIALSGLLMISVSRVKWWHLTCTLPPILLVAFWFVYHKEYRWTRMTAFMDPWKAPETTGYHMIQSLLSFSTGGLTGRGLGNGVQKLGYLPEDTTDFIFAVICEEMGLFGALFVIVLYLGIIYCAWQAVKQKRDSFGRMLAFGIGSMVGLQAIINIAVATVSVPTKGMSLPLISAGGSGLVITCCGLGILQSVLRYQHVQEEDIIPLPNEEMQVSTSDLAINELWEQKRVA